MDWYTAIGHSQVSASILANGCGFCEGMDESDLLTRLEDLKSDYDCCNVFVPVLLKVFGGIVNVMDKEDLDKLLNATVMT